MLSSMKNMFKVEDLRNKILFTIFMIGLYRLGSHVPVPGIDVSALQTLKDQSGQSGTLEFLRLFSGGAITQFAVFALGVMPYITSSIIMQILAVVIPKLEQWQQQGAVGQRKITQWTRYLTVAIAVMQSTGLTFLFKEGGQGFAGGNPFGEDFDLFGGNYNWSRVLIVVISLTAGTALIMWMGELITQRGIGNGMSLLIFASVVSQLPANFGAVKAESGTVAMALVALMFVGVLVAIVFVEQGQRRIPVQFAKRQVGRKQYGGQNTYIPLKVNASGVIPIIFANSMLYLPVMIGTVLPAKQNADGGGNWAYDVQQFIEDHFRRGTSALYLLTYGLLIIGFAYFYAAIQFDPHKQADQIRKQGGFIPGIRPGIQTERYLGRILNRITLPGAIFIALVALLPAFVLGRTLSSSAGLQLGFFGTSILIAVGVALETMKQIDSQLMMRNYEGFLKT